MDVTAPAESVEPARTWIRRYYPSLDGLRGIAIFLVFLRHSCYVIVPNAFFANCWMGVDLFFILSGFLITGILYDTAQEPHALRNFYVRRALRIYPLYWGSFALLFVVGYGLHWVWMSRYMSVWPLYAGNLVHPFLNMSVHNTDVVRFAWRSHVYVISLGYLWSLCVEEQFYLLWPLIVLRVRSRRTLMWIAAAGMALTLGLRLVLYAWKVPQAHHDLIYVSTYTRCDTLLAGAWCALWLRGVRLTRKQLYTVALSVGLPAAAILLVGINRTGSGNSSVVVTPFLGTWGFSLVALAGAAMLLISLDDASLLSRVFRFRPLAALGTVSYGFYLFHLLPLQLLPQVIPWFQTTRARQFFLAALCFAVCFLFSWLVFRFYELPFLRLKSVLAPSSHAGLPGPLHTAVKHTPQERPSA